MTPKRKEFKTMEMSNNKQQLIDSLKRYHDMFYTPGKYEHSVVGQAALMLEQIVELVRCIDCKHRDFEGFCKAYSDEGVWVHPNHSCLNGERKENGHSKGLNSLFGVFPDAIMNCNQECIKTQDNAFLRLEACETREDGMAAKDKRIAVAAIRKQIPTPPGRSSSGATLCPSCNRFLDRHEQKHGNLDIPYCKWCGQAIDWKGALDNGKQR